MKKFYNFCVAGAAYSLVTIIVLLVLALIIWILGNNPHRALTAFGVATIIFVIFYLLCVIIKYIDNGKKI